MDIRKIKKLIELVQESGVSEIEIREGEESVRISCKIDSPTHQIVMASPTNTPTVHVNSAPGTATLGEPKAAALPEGHVVTSPMVGTVNHAHTASTPTASRFNNHGITNITCEIDITFIIVI